MEKEIEKEPTEEEIQAMRKEIAAEEFDESSAPKTEPEPKKEAEPEIEKKVEPEDPWAEVNPALRESFDKMSAKVKDFDLMASRLKQTESRIGAIQNKLYAADQKAEKPPAPTKEEIDKAAAEKESWEELKEDFPEWAAAIDARMSKTNTALESKQKGLEEGQASMTRAVDEKIVNMAEKFEKTLLDFRHPDWESTIRTPQYEKWIKGQPAEIQQLTRSKLSKDAIKVLDGFSKTKDTETQHKSPAEIAAERKQRLKEAVPAEGTKTKPAIAEADMSDEALRKKIAAEVWAE